ncbi:hypothetical protein AB0A73_08225 [Glycomyces sp. NPDC047369]
MSPEPPPGPLVVRYNRTTGAWLLVIGAVMLLALLIQDLLFDPQRAVMYLLAYACAAVLVFGGATALVRTEYFTFDPRTDRLVARRFWGGRRVYPSPGYDWIAYSTGPVQIREVAPDGGSRVIPVAYLTADPGDWAEFLGRLDNLSAPEEPGPVEERP